MLRLALYGRPGAGKGTTAQLIANYCNQRGWPCHLLKLADPLYRAQHYLYTLAGTTLTSYYDQDGEVLNFLGAYLRKLNPSVLIDDFADRLKRTLDQLQGYTGCAVIVCDDMRSADSDFMRSLGFVHVYVSADPDIAVRRRSLRGDLSLGDAKHSTEQGIDLLLPDRVIDNNGTLGQLEHQVEELLDGLFHDPHRS